MNSITLLLLGALPIALTIPVETFNDNFKLNLQSQTSPRKQYNLNLSKREGGNSILHRNIKVITVDHDEATGKPVFNHWSPSEDELKSAEDVYLDKNNFAAVRMTQANDGTRTMTGVVDGHHFLHNGESYTLTSEEPMNGTDYIDLGITSGLTSGIPADEPVHAVVELAIVCDKEWGDLFQHNRQRILEYWSVYYWDMNMRYQTLPSVNISLRITSITVFSSVEAQSFIEEARNAEGKVHFSSVLRNFGGWIGSQSASNAIPKYDAALLALNTQMAEGYGGMAYLGWACSPTLGVGVHIAGSHYGINTMVIAAHELAHILNGHHRSEMPECEEKRPGFIMSENGNEDRIHLGYFFDSCNDRRISDFVRSDRAACLRRIDETGDDLPVDPSFESVDPPSLAEQCKMLTNNDAAQLGSGDEGNCYDPLCWRDGYGVRFRPVDNSPCLGGGRCFRGRCLKPSFLLKNVGSGECLLGKDRFLGKDSAIMAPCPQYPTPMNKVQKIDLGEGIFQLASPYTDRNVTENTDKCLWTGNGEGHALGFDTCTRGYTSTYRWNLRPAGNSDEFLLCNVNNGACAIQDGDRIKSYTNYDFENPFMRWRLA